MLLLILIFFLSLILPLLLWGTFLRVGLHWAKVEDVPVMKLVRVIILTIVVESLVLFALDSLETIEAIKAAILAFGIIVFSLILQPAIIKWVFKTTFLRSLQAWVTTFLMPLILVPFFLFVVKPYVFEAFVLSGNSMTPTLVAEHRQEKCSICGNTAFGSPLIPGYFRVDSVICETNFHETNTQWDVETVDNQIGVCGADKFIVDKFLTPKRWDIVAFKYPADDSIVYAKRLVGMPGEEIIIRNGFVYADGKKLIPPESIQEIKYETPLREHGKEMWGSPDNPAKLATDEYFILGDFSKQSSDSRIWEKGASGHPPYAVPNSHLVGVVTHIYWPPERWRSFR